jgi:SAM-dependent methyltransferase
MVFMKRDTCMNCGGSALHEFLDLGNQPNGNNFLYNTEVGDEPYFSLSMLVCEECWQVQISDFPSPEFMFANHPYVTGVNAPVTRHFKNLAPHVVGKLGLKPNDLVVDIGCNDGSLLKCFAEEGMRTLGVDPGKRTGELARQQGITVFRQFWTEETGKSLKQLGVQPNVITATAVFYHVPDLHNFVAGLTEVMGPDSFFVVQGVNLRDLIEKNEFDHFYHEHSCIHSVAPLMRLFAAHGLRIQDIEMSDIHGGSFILYVCRTENPLPTTPAVEEALERDRQAGLAKLSTYDAFADRVRHNCESLVTLLRQLKQEGKSVYALGAPVKGSTILNYCGIGPDLVSCATEVNQFKIGRVTPGTHIPVVDERTLVTEPDYYLVLAWNFIDYLREKYHSYLSNGGRFIVAVPDVQVLGPIESVSGKGEA